MYVCVKLLKNCALQKKTKLKFEINIPTGYQYQQICGCMEDLYKVTVDQI